MKIVKVIAVLALLVLFPAISYLYLMKGYNFRLEALQELEPKLEITTFDYEPTGNLESLVDKATILYNADNDLARSMLEPIFEQFSHREEFQMFGFTDDSLKLRGQALSEQWKIIFGKYPYEKEIALVDTSVTIRNYYDFDFTSFTSLGQHIPIIIPRKKEKDIVLKREDEK